jgi:hypothetical protein
VPNHKLALINVIQLIGVRRVTSLSSLSPVMTILMHLLGEAPTSLQLIGVVILLRALLIAANDPARPRPRPKAGRLIAVHIKGDRSFAIANPRSCL